MKKFTHKQALTVLKRYAMAITRFHESSDAPDGEVRVGFYIKGSIGSADDFWNAMRALRRTKAEAERQHDRERKRLRR
mgnify:CR=1 FL=1